MVIMMDSNFPVSSRGASASIETDDQVLVSFGRTLARTSRTVLVSGSAKNFPRLTTRATAMRSSDPMDGVTWLFSTWEIRLGEKPVLAARAVYLQRTENCRARKQVVSLPSRLRGRGR